MKLLHIAVFTFGLAALAGCQSGTMRDIESGAKNEACKTSCEEGRATCQEKCEEEVDKDACKLACDAGRDKCAKECKQS